MSGAVDDARKCLVDAVGPLIRDANAAAYQTPKIIHDPVWGTTRLETWEAALLDIPIFQRLRGIKQTGFAHFTYPSAEHSRFQHTLGVAHAAGGIVKSLRRRIDEGGIQPGPAETTNRIRALLKEPRTRILVRVAAFVHDLGHSFYSHTSERVFSLIPPLPSVIEELRSDLGTKRPGAAEAIVYLLLTSETWQEAATRAWKGATGIVDPPTRQEWQQIGLWVLGHEQDPESKFLSDIISGPIDADKLDYIARDAYSAGLPITYDLDRFVATVTVDYQNGRARLTIPARGINALEQLVMSRLVLNSYLYHHQKVRAAEASFERVLLREWFGERKIMDCIPPWPMFTMEDADVYAHANQHTTSRLGRLIRRQLPVRLAEFRRSSLEESKSELVTAAYTHLLADETTMKESSYKRRLELEDELADAAGLEPGDIIIDVPRPPSYGDLEDLKVPPSNDTAQEILDYNRWIQAYQVHRAFIRIFCPRDAASATEVWIKVKAALHEKHIPIPDAARRYG